MIEDNRIVYECSARPESTPQYTDYENSTYTVVSKMAFLLGVEKRHFENEHEPPKMEWYDKLHNDKNARIIRNLCALRTALERNYAAIYKQMRYELKNLHSMPDLIPQSSLLELLEDGIAVEKSNYQPNQYIMDLNRLITDRINNCKQLFPLWPKWEYICALFIMPNGHTEYGIRAAAAEYYANKNKYPYEIVLYSAEISGVPLPGKISLWQYSSVSVKIAFSESRIILSLRHYMIHTYLRS